MTRTEPGGFGGVLLAGGGTRAPGRGARGWVGFHGGGHDRGALTAFDVATGEVRWSWSGDGPSYASPIVAELDGVRQIVTLTQQNVVGVAAGTGALLWRGPCTPRAAQNI